MLYLKFVPRRDTDLTGKKDGTKESLRKLGRYTL
jgi:hypothetical protein